MVVCLCKGVPDRVVRLAVINGATTIDSVSARCGAGTDCGACVPMIHDLIQEVAAETMAAGGRADAGHGQSCCEDDVAPAEQQNASAGA